MLAFDLFSVGAAIKAGVVAVAGIVWLLVRRAKKKDDPQNQYDAAKKKTDDEIARGDADAVNRELDELTDRVRDDKNHSG